MEIPRVTIATEDSDGCLPDSRGTIHSLEVVTLAIHPVHPGGDQSVPEPEGGGLELV